MANASKKVPDNISGEFFVDSTCINCGTCRKFAPDVFADNRETSYVSHQPPNPEQTFKTMQALVACPVHAIGAEKLKVSREVMASFPVEIEDGVYLNGFNAESSYGADSYFIHDTAGNWLIDSPRFTPSLVNAFEKMGGIKYIFLTHRDDIADAKKYADHFKAETIIHTLDRDAYPNATMVLDKSETVIGDAKILHTPGHTEGHCVLLWKNLYLFTGDHLPWSTAKNALRPFRDALWYSWDEQIKSVELLGTLSNVQWVLPGHGERKFFTGAEFKRSIAESVEWMKTK